MANDIDGDGAMPWAAIEATESIGPALASLLLRWQDFFLKPAVQDIIADQQIALLPFRPGS